MLNFGGIRGNRLAQGQFGAGTDNTEAFGVLKKVASELKGRTAQGVWVVTEAGNVGYTKAFRVSDGAAAASRAGKLELTNVAFTQTIRVDPPEDLSQRTST